MKLLALFAAAVSAGLALATEPLMIATPVELKTCEPALIFWSGGHPGYFLSIIPGGQVSAAPIESFPETWQTQLNWTVNIPAGSYITFELRDSAGEIQYTAPVTVQAGEDTSRL